MSNKPKTVTITFQSFVPPKIDIHPSNPKLEVTRVEVYGPPIGASSKMPKLSESMWALSGNEVLLSYRENIPLPSIGLSHPVPVSQIAKMFTDADLVRIYAETWKKTCEPIKAIVSRLASKL